MGASPRRVSCVPVLVTWGVSRCALVSPWARTPLVPSP
ncbi:hypothetical protein A2U01_0113541, partial [Trifolium medium]|nr:hypothetical protein [Trifolium medium]